jgi:hypothetical protein
MKTNTPQQTLNIATRANFATTDLLKLLAGAIASGVAVSFAAAGLALALAGSANATPMAKSAVIMSVPQKNVDSTIDSEMTTEANADSFPGSLRIGGGCDSEPIDAQEREWLVSIDGNKAKVRVIQSFNMPLDGGTVAFFDAALPGKAELIDLSIQSGGRTWQGRVMKADAMAKLDRDGFRALDAKGVVLMWVDAGYVSTDQIVNLVAGEVVTVEYTYAIKIETQKTEGSIVINLAPHRMVDASGGTGEGITQSTNQRPNEKPAPVSGTVWVEFVGALPKQVRSAKNTLILDQSPAGIRGGSWFSPALDKAEKFIITWDLSSDIDSSQRVAQR